MTGLLRFARNDGDQPSPTPPRPRWRIAPPLTAQQLGRLPNRGTAFGTGLPPTIAQLLHNRGIREPDQIYDFLTSPGLQGNPFLLKGMHPAVNRIRRAIRNSEPIAVYGDFDVDGVTATVLLVQTLSALGARVQPYIPHRVDEGYGLNLDALRHLWRQGVRLVITVDCGIRSVTEVQKAAASLDLIITDHHGPGQDLPPAVAIINPKQPGCPYPFKELAGVGLAFKLAQALLRVQHTMQPGCDLEEDALLDLVALGTVADLAPLLGENRALVRRGLEILNESPAGSCHCVQDRRTPRPAATSLRAGIRALMASAGLRRGEVDATAIGFRLGPRLNAAGRIDSAMLAYRLLASNDPLETKELADKLTALNQQRQQLTGQTVAAAEAQVLAHDPDAYLYLAASSDFLPGIVGLAASRLTETYYRPSIVVELGPSESRGSCRSIPEFHITEALDACHDLLIRHGGHAAAAGFTIATKDLDALHRRLQALAAEQLAAVDLRPALDIDLEIPLEEVDWATQALLQQMEPCGAGNPQPLLLSRGVELRHKRAIGSEQQHLKLVLRDQRNATWDAIFFRRGQLLDQACHEGSDRACHEGSDRACHEGSDRACPERLDIVYTLERNDWQGQKRLQLNIQDLRPCPQP